MSGRELIDGGGSEAADLESDAPRSSQTGEQEYRWAPPPPRRARRTRRRRITRVIVVVAILLAVVGAAVPLTLQWLAQQTANAHGAAAAKTVSAYLQAVAAGDAERALSFVSDAPAPGGLLSDEALAVSKAQAPLTDIDAVVAPIEGAEGRVSVSYRLGDTPVSTVFDVVDTDESGEYRVASLPVLDLGTRFQGLSATVDGTAVTGGEIAVLPGLHVLAVPMEMFTLSGAEPVLVTGTTTTTLPDTVLPVLTDAGVTAYRAAVVGAVNGCLASRALAGGCGLDLPQTLADGTTLYDGSVFRALTPDALARLAAVVPVLDPANPAVAVGEGLGAVDAAANCTQGGANGECDIVPAPGLARASVTMTESPLAVRWG